MNKFNKGFAPLITIIIIAAVVLVGGGVGYYFVTKTKPVVQNQTQTETQQTQTQQQKTQIQNTNVNDIAVPLAPCGIHFQMQGGKMSADECYIDASISQDRSTNPQTQHINSTLVIFDKSQLKYIHVAIINEVLPVGTTVTQNETYSPKTGNIFVQGVLDQKLTVGTITMTPITATKFNVVFNFSFEGNVSVKGYGVLSSQGVAYP